MLEYYSAHTPDTAAIVYGDKAESTVSWAELLCLVKKRAAELSAKGASAIGILTDGSFACVLEIFAAAMAGLRIILLDENLDEEILRELLKVVEADLLFADEDTTKSLRDVVLLPASADGSLLNGAAPASVDGSLHDGVAPASETDFSWNNTASISLSECSLSECSLSERSLSERSLSESSWNMAPPAAQDKNKSDEILFFTSGTTSRSKAVVLTQESLMASAWNGSSLLPLFPEDRLLCMLPLSHVFGFVCGLLWGLSCGACVALGRGARHYADDCLVFKPTAVSLVPMQLAFLLKYKVLNPELKTVLIGAGDCPDELFSAAQSLGLKVCFGYGLTETGSGVALSVSGDPRAMEICPADTVSIASDGEILVSSPLCMMQGYFKNPEDTASVLKDGIFRTGDLGFLDEDGKLHVIGRKKEIIVLPDGGKIFLPEYEDECARALHITDLCILEKDGRILLVLAQDKEPGKSTDQSTGRASGKDTGKSAVSTPNENACICAVSESAKYTCKKSDSASGKDTGKSAVSEIDKNHLQEKQQLFALLKPVLDLRPRSQKIHEIIITDKPLPKTAAGKLKRWEVLKWLQENS